MRRKASAYKSTDRVALQLQSMTLTTTQEDPWQTLMRFPVRKSRSGLIAAYRPPACPLVHRDWPGRQYHVAVPLTELEV